MPKKRACRPGVESMEGRIAMSTTLVPGDVGGVINPTLQAYAVAYLSVQGQPRYNPQADTSNNGFVGQGDVEPILRSLAPSTPKIPQSVKIALAPGEQVNGPHPQNSGGVTRDTTVTVVGRTTPNSIIFTDGGPSFTRKKYPPGSFIANAYKFLGPPLASDSAGYFYDKINLSAALTQTEFLVKDPLGHQTVVAFPILLLSK